jgi:hypothetical protein
MHTFRVFISALERMIKGQSDRGVGGNKVYWFLWHHRKHPNYAGTIRLALDNRSYRRVDTVIGLLLPTPHDIVTLRSLSTNQPFRRTDYLGE